MIFVREKFTFPNVAKSNLPYYVKVFIFSNLYLLRASVSFGYFSEASQYRLVKLFKH